MTSAVASTPALNPMLPFSADTKITWSKETIAQAAANFNVMFRAWSYAPLEGEAGERAAALCLENNLVLDGAFDAQGRLLSATLHDCDIANVMDIDAGLRSQTPFLVVRFYARKIDHNWHYALDFLDRQGRVIDDLALYEERQRLDLLDLRSALLEHIRRGWWDDEDTPILGKSDLPAICAKIGQLFADSRDHAANATAPPTSYHLWTYLGGIGACPEIVGWKSHFEPFAWKENLEQKPQQKDAYYKILTLVPTDSSSPVQIFGLPKDKLRQNLSQTITTTLKA